MALTAFQRDVCRLLAGRRRASGESYVAGGLALNVALKADRVSRDTDIFHDSTAAVAASWDADRQLLSASGYGVDVERERPGYVEAVIHRGGATVRAEWARDSAFRFFPLVEHPEFGLALHPFDLATNKVLALVGRAEARDWVDILQCHCVLQPLGYLTWAASGKDPGFTPSGILAQAARTARYTQPEIDALAFDGEPPRAEELSREWHAVLNDAREVVATLPAAEVGRAVLLRDGNPFRGDAGTLTTALSRGELQFHPGHVGGAWPAIVR